MGRIAGHQVFDLQVQPGAVAATPDGAAVDVLVDLRRQRARRRMLAAKNRGS